MTHEWWFPERGEAELFGWAESNINVLTDDNLRELVRMINEELDSLQEQYREKKTFLRSFVRSVDVSMSEVTINYTLPMPLPDRDKETVGGSCF